MSKPEITSTSDLQMKEHTVRESSVSKGKEYRQPVSKKATQDSRTEQISEPKRRGKLFPLVTFIRERHYES